MPGNASFGQVEVPPGARMRMYAGAVLHVHVHVHCTCMLVVRSSSANASHVYNWAPPLLGSTVSPG